VASSSTTVRTWERQGTTLHHIVDPSTGWPADPEWRLVTVAARTCVEANTAATAAVVWGEDALFEIAQRGLAARFVRRDGEVIEVGGWPSPESESDRKAVHADAGGKQSHPLVHHAGLGTVALVLFTATVVLGILSTTRVPRRTGPGSR